MIQRWKMIFMAGFFLLSVSQAWAIPVSLTVGGSPELFEFTGGTGWVDTPADGYSLSTTTSVRIDLTDRLMIGDQYQLYVNNVLAMTTSSVPTFLDGSQTGTTTFDQAWSTPYLSKGFLYLGPGTYDLDIKAIRVAAGVTYGSGWIRAVGVPEPPVVMLLGLGLLLCGWLAQRHGLVDRSN